MLGIGAVLEELVMSALLNEKILMPRGSRMGRVFLGLSILLTVAGVFFLLSALNKYFEGIYPTDIAALISGVLMLAAAFLCAAGAWRLHRKKAELLTSARDELVQNIRILFKDISGEMENPIRENPKMAVLLAVLAGFFTANHQIK
jgi:hypothetical protein